MGEPHSQTVLQRVAGAVLARLLPPRKHAAQLVHGGLPLRARTPRSRLAAASRAPLAPLRRLLPAVQRLLVLQGPSQSLVRPWLGRELAAVLLAVCAWCCDVPQR